MKTYDVLLCHSTRHDADTATENTMAMVYVLLKDQLGSRPRGQARRGGDPRRLRPSPQQEHEIVMLLNFADELRRRVPAGK
jgi:hypothetical protein